MTIKSCFCCYFVIKVELNYNAKCYWLLNRPPAMLLCNSNKSGILYTFSLIDFHLFFSNRLSRCQFLQHFTSSFFVRKSFGQLFCTYGLGLYIFGTRILAQKLLVKCWWNWPQFADEHGEVCPAKWKPGKKSLKPTKEGVSQYLSTMTLKVTTNKGEVNFT